MELELWNWNYGIGISRNIDKSWNWVTSSREETVIYRLDILIVRHLWEPSTQTPRVMDTS